MKKRNDMACEIDERILRTAKRGDRRIAGTPELKRKWTDAAPPDNPDDNYDFGETTLSCPESETKLSGDVTLKGDAGIEVTCDELENALVFSLDARRSSLLGLGESYAPAKLTTNDIGESIITVFRLANMGAVYALTAGAIWRVDETAGELAIVEGAAPQTGEEFTCTCVYQGHAFIGTRKTNGQMLVLYRFDGESLFAELTIATMGADMEITAMCVIAMSLCALVGGLSQGSVGWTVYRRIVPGGWGAIVAWQAGAYASDLTGTNELVVSARDGSATSIYSLFLGIGQTAAMPVLSMPNPYPLTFDGAGKLARNGREIIAANASTLYAITDATPKTWSGSPAIEIMRLFEIPTPYSQPSGMFSVVSIETALGARVAGLFVFGARVVFNVFGQGEETRTYLFGYDGGELIELFSWAGGDAPFFKPVEVALDGSLLLIGVSEDDAPYVWKMDWDVVRALAYGGRACTP